MKKFIFEAFIFSGIPIIVCFLVFFRLDGYTDPFYIRFTTPKQTSLIVGTSRAAQGLQPSILNESLQRDDIYNYAFTVAHSSYGPTYLESIKNKIKGGARNGIFIVTVDPWSISSTAENPDDSSSFPELKLALAKTKIVDINPNILYLARSYEKPFIDLFKSSQNSGMFLHKNGWLEVTIPMDSESVAKRLEQKILEYKTINLPKYKFSSLRFKYLFKTISFLQDHGTVYLVRLPMHPKMYEIETLLMPDFDERIIELSKKANTEYMSLKDFGNDYEFIDGNHLYKSSGKKVSIEIGNWISKLRERGLLK